MSTGYFLDKDEKVIQRFDRHWIDLVPAFSSSAMLAVAAIGGMFVLARYGADIETAIPVLPPGYFLPLALIGVLLMLGLSILIFFVGLWVYQGNYMLLTNTHLIQVEQTGLFGRKTAQLPLTQIEDAHGKRRGILQTLLNFGNIEVQTAGAAENFIFLTAPNPELMADRILEHHEQFLRTTPHHH